ncbi:MAG: anti-sigma F factor [Ruminococcaceae bacterium]|nr:anti-sigma F factor [Oscillospiraceae bacterium]
MIPTNEISITFPSRSANEGYARAAVSAFAAQMDPTLDELGDIKTAVSEAVTNCIVHAYPDTVGKIYIRLKSFEGNILEIIIRDRGLGIPDIDKAKTPLFTTGGDDRSGMGFTIMESFMDNLKVRSKPGVGTTITMRKKISMRLGGLARDKFC